MNEVREPSSLRLAGSLALAGLFSGLVLVSVYLATLPRIQQNQARALDRAIYNVLPNTESIEPLMLRGSELVPFDGPPGAPTKERVIYLGKDAQGARIGYAVPAQGAGFQDTIKLLYGYDPVRRAVIGMEVLESRETPGLGDKIIFDEHFKRNFIALEIDPQIELVKKGAKTKPYQVDSITGATISARAVANILGQSTREWATHLAVDPDGKTASSKTGGGEP